MSAPELHGLSKSTGASVKMVRGRRERTSAVDALFYLSILLFIGRALQGSIFFLYGALATGMAVFAYYALSNRAVAPKFWLLLALFGCGYVMSLARNAFGSGSLFLPLYLASAGVAWRIHLRGIDYRFATALFYGAAADFFIEYYILGRDPHAIFANSGNHISITFISLAALVYIAATVNQHERALMPAFVSFVISVLSLGVGGIVASGLMLVGVLVYLIVVVPRFRVNASVALIGGGLVVMLQYEAIRANVELRTTDFYLAGSDLSTKLNTTQLASGNDRYQIWAEYLKRTDTEQLLLGSRLDVLYYGYANLHSSYFLLHARTGVWFFPIMAVLLASTIGLVRYPLLLVCLLAIWIRAYSDTIFLGIGNYDWVLLYLVLFAGRRVVSTKGTPLNVGQRPRRWIAAPDSRFVASQAGL